MRRRCCARRSKRWGSSGDVPRGSRWPRRSPRSSPRAPAPPSSTGLDAKLGCSPEAIAAIRKQAPTGLVRLATVSCATLHDTVDAETGRTLWRLSGRATAFWSDAPKPAISPDGRLALIPLPDERGRRMIGLVAMRDGHLLDRWSVVAAGSHPQAFGFTRDGAIWVSCMALTLTFRIEEPGGRTPGSPNAPQVASAGR